jgi:hypothetical protein
LGKSGNDEQAKCQREESAVTHEKF